jgi:F-type H+-transporting ATPase subunit b
VFAANHFRFGLIAVCAAIFVGVATAWSAPVAHAAAEPAGAASAQDGKMEDAEGAVEPKTTPGPEEFRTDMAIWTFVVFIVLLLILTKFAWGPIVAGLQKREQGIADNIAAAQRSYDEAKQYLAEYEKKLANAANEVRAMLEEARRDAEATKQEIIAEAKEAAHLEQQRGQREVRTAMDQALKELSERSTNMAVGLAGKIVQAQLKPSDHARLVQEAVSQFTRNGPSAN